MASYKLPGTVELITDGPLLPNVKLAGFGVRLFATEGAKTGTIAAFEGGIAKNILEEN